MTLSEEPSGSFEIYPVCFWEEDDGVQFENPDMEGGANSVSSNQAKSNFKRINAIDEAVLKMLDTPRADDSLK